MVENEVIETIDTKKLPDFGIEYTRIVRDSCAGCYKKIHKGEIRIMKVVYNTGQNTTCDGKATWYHFACFARLRFELDWLQSAESLPGFRKLCEEDKEMLNNLIP